MYRNHRYALLILFSLLLFTGCNDTQNEAGNPKFIRAKKLNERDKYPEAVEAFNEYLLINPRSVKTHMFLADLYYDHIDEPLNAIYHYRRVLILDPNSEEKDIIGKYLQNAETKYYKSLEERYADEGDIGVLEKELDLMKLKAAKYYRAAVKLNTMNKALKKQLEQKNIQMKSKEAELLALKSTKVVESVVRKQSLPSIKQTAQRTQKNVSRTPAVNKNTNVSAPHKTPTTYVIQPGDNLMLISKKVYGSTKHFKHIFQANKRVMPSLSRLKVGQRIVIPKLNK